MSAARLDALLAIIRSEAGADVADRIERRTRLELHGLRIAIPSAATRRRPSGVAIEQALEACGWNVAAAAARLGVHQATVYRWQRARARAARRRPASIR